MLTFKTDKDTYAPGEQIVVTFPSVKGSRAIISIENGTRVLSTTEHMCNDGQTTVKLAVTPDMQPNGVPLYNTLATAWCHEERPADPHVRCRPLHGYIS